MTRFVTEIDSKEVYDAIDAALRYFEQEITNIENGSSEYPNETPEKRDRFLHDFRGWKVTMKKLRHIAEANEV